MFFEQLIYIVNQALTIKLERLFERFKMALILWRYD